MGCAGCLYVVLLCEGPIKQNFSNLRVLLEGLDGSDNVTVQVQCVKTHVNHFRAGHIRKQPWGSSSITALRFLAKNVGNGARGHQESIHRKPNLTQGFCFEGGKQYSPPGGREFVLSGT
jgi:hypothetical protein